MNYIKYFQDNEYIENKKDCWAFVQQVYKDEHNKVLPDYPIVEKPNIATALMSNMRVEETDTAEKGCIVYYHNGTTHHAGYCLNSKEFIHKTIKGVKIDKIPKKSTIYKVLND